MNADCYWWVEPVINFLAIIVGAGMVIYQMRSQHQGNMALQEKQSQEKLKLEVYETLAFQIDEAQKEITSLSSMIFTLPSKIEFYWRSKNQWGFDPPPIEPDANALIKNRHRSQTIVTNLIFTLEKYEAALFELSNFYLAFSLQGGVLDKTFREFLLTILPFLPSEIPPDKAAKLGIKITTPLEPSNEEFKELKDAADIYHNAALDLICYIKDLSIEAQNHLVGSLFGKLIPSRKPNDPSCIVIKPGADGKKYIETAFKKL